MSFGNRLSISVYASCTDISLICCKEETKGYSRRKPSRYLEGLGGTRDSRSARGIMFPGSDLRLREEFAIAETRKAARFVTGKGSCRPYVRLTDFLLGIHHPIYIALLAR